MHFNYCVLFGCLLKIVSVTCECDSYLECLSDFVSNFFANNDTLESVPADTTKDLIEVKDVDLEVVQKVLSDVSKLLKSERDGKNNKGKKAVYKHIHDNNKIILKSFDILKSDEKINDETINISGTDLDVETTTVDNLPEKVPNDTVKSKEKVDLNSDENTQANEIPDADDEDPMYYDIPDDNSTDYPIIDYIEIYKDTTNEDTYVSTEIPNTEVDKIRQEIIHRTKDIDNLINYSIGLMKSEFNNTANLGGSCNGNASSAGLADVVYPWLASIFIKNSTSSNQFQYNCDGAILSERIILTAARCVSSEMTVDPENLLVVLGKKYLQSMASHERTHKIKEIYTHDNFTVKDGVACNDLAILVMEENAIFNEYIQPSCMSDKYGDFVQAATTAWDITGTLHPVYFEKMESQSCDHSNKDENTFCATYGNHIPLCPNYGGIYVTKQLDNQWYLQGIRTGDPTVRGLCFDKTVIFTSLKNHTEWISETVDNIKQFY